MGEEKKIKKDKNGREYYEYSIISKINEQKEIEHSYAGYVNSNANVEDPIIVPFGEDYRSYKKNYYPARVLKETQEEHKRLLKQIKRIKTIETKIIQYIK